MVLKGPCSSKVAFYDNSEYQKIRLCPWHPDLSPESPLPLHEPTNQIVSLLVTDEVLEHSWPWETGLLGSDTRALAELPWSSHSRARGPWAGSVSVQWRVTPARGPLSEKRIHCSGDCEQSSLGVAAWLKWPLKWPFHVLFAQGASAKLLGQTAECWQLHF